MSLPLVSVVVPTHNRVMFLKETLASILNQTFTDFELIVVSDGSTDGTNEMVSELDDTRVRLIAQSQSGQPAKPRNTGILASRGKFIALCDDDDVWEANKLEIQIENMLNDSSFDMCYTNGRVLRDGLVQEGMLNRRKVINGHFNELLYGNFIPNSSVLIKKDVFDRIGLINTANVFRGIEDYEFWLRLSYNCSLLYIDSPLIQYRVHSSNITYSRSYETARAINVIKHLNKLLNIPKWLLLKVLIIQYSKYWIYRLIRR
jgi:glycosyltransferase involved in cell wall biosynthesis